MTSMLIWHGYILTPRSSGELPEFGESGHIFGLHHLVEHPAPHAKESVAAGIGLGDIAAVYPAEHAPEEGPVTCGDALLLQRLESPECEEHGHLETGRRRSGGDDKGGVRACPYRRKRPPWIPSSSFLLLPYGSSFKNLTISYGLSVAVVQQLRQFEWLLDELFGEHSAHHVAGFAYFATGQFVEYTVVPSRRVLDDAALTQYGQML